MTSSWRTVQTTICEFLESSTIHGLVYISTSKTILAKVLWICIITLGFSTAGYLIYDSFYDWAESPTVTSVETFPISEVPFPEVTVCPPLGSNTALNYDLIIADNLTIDNETRNELVKLANSAFIESYHDRYVDDNHFYEAKDIENIYRGLGKLSTPYKEITNNYQYVNMTSWKYKTEFSATSGHFKTPYFGGRYDPLKYALNLQYTIEIP